MNHLPTSHLDDDAISAILDGQGSDADLRHLETCERCTERRRRFSAARDLVATPVGLFEAAREAQIRRALEVEVPATGRPRRDLGSLLRVAAAILVVLVSVPLVASLAGDDEDTAQKRASSDASAEPGAVPEEAASEAEDRDGDESDGAAGDGSLPVQPTATTSTSPDPSASRAAGVDLGMVGPDVDLSSSLGAALDRAADQRPPSEPSGPSSALEGPLGPCAEAIARADPAVQGLRLVGRGLFAGAPAEVYVYDDILPDAVIAVVAEPGTCRVLDRQSFPDPVAG